MSESIERHEWKPRPMADVFSGMLGAEAAREVARFEQELPAIEKRFTDGKVDVRKNLDEVTSLLTATDETIDTMASRNWFQSAWAKLTGQEARDVAEVRQNLSRVQSRGLVVIDRLMARQDYLQQATRYLGARIELVQIDNLKIKRALVELGRRITSRIEAAEGRIGNVEKRVDTLEDKFAVMARNLHLVEYFQTDYSPSFGCAYAEIEEPLSRALTLLFDFVTLTEGQWRAIDVHRLREHSNIRVFPDGAEEFGIKEIMRRSLMMLPSPDHERLRNWLKGENGSLYDGLMASRLSEAVDGKVAWSRYPTHFVLLRPYWLVAEQGADPQEDLGFMMRQVLRHRIVTDASFSPWDIVRMLLEERLAWSFERQQDSPRRTDSKPDSPSGRYQHNQGQSQPDLERKQAGDPRFESYQNVRVIRNGKWIKAVVLRDNGNSVDVKLASGTRITVERKDVTVPSTFHTEARERAEAYIHDRWIPCYIVREYGSEYGVSTSETNPNDSVIMVHKSKVRRK